jgi:hypothetical protein
MTISKTNWVALALIFAVVLGYIAARKINPDSQTMSIRTYAVPASRSEEIKNVLNRMFSTDKTDGSAQVFGNGTLIVKGPESYQAGISRLVSEISDKKRSLHTIHFDYWLVRGEAATPSNADQIAPLASVLATINKAQGSKNFKLLEHIGFNSLDRREVVLQGSLAEVKNISKEVDDAIELSTEINAHRLGQLRINTQVKSGEFVILGENGLGASEDEHHSKELYHIIRAETLQ